MQVMDKHSFGSQLREARLASGFSLREFARRVGVSSTYLSQVERDNFPKPTASRMVRIAELLGDDADHWIGLAGRISEDLEPIIRRHATGMPELIRAANELSGEEIEEAIRLIKLLLNGQRTVPNFESNRLAC